MDWYSIGVIIGEKAKVVRVRQVSREKYVLAALITVLIFSMGLILGLFIEGKRLVYIESARNEQSLDFTSLQLQYAFMDQFSKEENCAVVSKTFEKNIENLESTRQRLEEFDLDATVSKEEFGGLKREYILAQVRYWLFAKRTKEVCGDDILTVLYFFSDTDSCPDCDKQSFVLTYLKRLFKEKLLIFSFDSRQQDEPMIPILQLTYNITSYPSVVVGNKRLDKFQDKDAVLKEICKTLKDEKTCQAKS